MNMFDESKVITLSYFVINFYLILFFNIKVSMLSCLQCNSLENSTCYQGTDFKPTLCEAPSKACTKFTASYDDGKIIFN